MFQRILVPLNGSDEAERVLPRVEAYGKASRSRVALLRVLEHVADVQDAALARDLPEIARRYLDGVVRRLASAGIRAVPFVDEGSPAGEIVERASPDRFDLIATASHGSAVTRFLLGSVAEKVTRMAQVPVLVVRSRMPLERQPSVRRIIVRLDGSQLAETVLPLTVELAHFHRAEVVLLHVLPDERPAPDVLDSRLNSLRREGVSASVRVARGDPATEILRSAE